jgi:hypothetical protein
MIWNNDKDTLSYRQTETKIPTDPTKRIVLRQTASFFDPLGLLSPLTMPAIPFFSRLWDHNYKWDDKLSLEHAEEWKIHHLNLKEGSLLKIPRHHSFDSAMKTQMINLNVFTDASLKAGGASAYLQQGSQVVLVGSNFKLTAKVSETQLQSQKEN